MRLLSTLCVFAFAGVAFAADKTEAKKPDSVQYEIELKVFAKENGEQKTLANPTLMVLENRSATFVLGGEVPVVKLGKDGRPEIEFLNDGLSITVTVRKPLKGNKVLLDASFARSNVVGHGDRVRTETKTVRSREVVRLGRTIELTLEEDEAKDSEGWAEITVRQVLPEKK